MFKMIDNLFGYVLSISNWLLLFGGVIIVSYLFFTTKNPVQALTIDKVEIVNTTILPTEPLQLRFHAVVGKAGCDIYAERTVSDVKTGEVVWQTISPITPHVLDKELADNGKPIIVPIGPIKPGKYYYYAKVHMICDKTVEIIPTKLLPFTVVTPIEAEK